jgi:hypothetical protein
MKELLVSMFRSFYLRLDTNDNFILKVIRFHSLHQNQQLQSKEKTMGYMLNAAFVDLHWRILNTAIGISNQNIKYIELFSRRWRPGQNKSNIVFLSSEKARSGFLFVNYNSVLPSIIQGEDWTTRRWPAFWGQKPAQFQIQNVICRIS